MLRYAPLAILPLALAACSPPESGTSPAATTQSPAPGASLTTDQDKTLYALGLAIGGNVREFSLTGAELAIVSDGIRDAVLGNQPKVQLEVYGPRIQELAQQRASVASNAEKQASEAWVAQQAREPGAERGPSGVVFIPISEGTGANPTSTSTVEVHYH